MALIGLYNKAVTEGTEYQTGELLQDIDTNFGEIEIAENYTFQFTNANLVDGVLTVTHNLGTEFPYPILKRPDNAYEVAIGFMRYVNTNQVQFDFGGSIEAGTWKGLLIKLY